MARHAVPQQWRSGLTEIGPRIFAYVQASGPDPRGDTGVSNSGLIVGAASAVAVDALMVPSMTRRLVAAYRKATRKPIARLINTHHHLDPATAFSAGPRSSPPRSAGKPWPPASRRCLCSSASCRASPASSRA